MHDDNIFEFGLRKFACSCAVFDRTLFYVTKEEGVTGSLPLNPSMHD